MAIASVGSAGSDRSQLAARLQSDNRSLAADTKAKASQSRLASDRARIQADQQALAAQRRTKASAPSKPLGSGLALGSNSARGAVEAYL